MPSSLFAWLCAPGRLCHYPPCSRVEGDRWAERPFGAKERPSPALSVSISSLALFPSPCLNCVSGFGYFFQTALSSSSSSRGFLWDPCRCFAATVRYADGSLNKSRNGDGWMDERPGRASACSKSHQERAIEFRVRLWVFFQSLNRERIPKRWKIIRFQSLNSNKMFKCDSKGQFQKSIRAIE